MAGSTIETLIETAKKEVRKKVVRAQKNRSSEVLKVLQAIAEDLFKPTFNVDQMVRAGIVDWRIRKQFRAELGLGIKAYLQELSKAAATWLLVKTDIPIKEIAVGLGHARERAYNFSRDFKRWTGETPEEYRSARRGKLKAYDGWLERVVNEALRAEPKKVVLPPGLFVYLSGDDDEEMAEAVWAVLREETPTRQIELLHFEFFFGGPELFELLSRVSREVGRRDRQLGLRLAEVGLAAVEGSRALLDERYSELHALALARLANAMRLAGDLPEADEILMRALEARDERRTLCSKRVEAEMVTIEGTLRLFQRRFGEARKLLGSALQVAEDIDDLNWQVNARLQRAAVAGYEDRPDKMIPDLRAIVGLLFKQEEPNQLQLLFVYQDLNYAYLKTGEIEHAVAELPRAKALCERLDHTACRHQLYWIEGLIAKARDDLRVAEQFFRRARAGFKEIGDPYSVAMASLEIAILCTEPRRSSEVMDLLTNEVIPTLEALNLDGEALCAVRLLRKALGKREVPRAILETVREALLSIPPRFAGTRKSGPSLAWPQFWRSESAGGIADPPERTDANRPLRPRSTLSAAPT